MRPIVRLSTNHRVLVLDSDDAERTRTAQALRDGGLSVYEARTFAEAVHLVQQEAAAAVVVNLGTDASGVEGRMHLLMAADSSLRVVVLAAVHDAEAAVRATAAGADAFLIKPVDSVALNACVRVAIERHHTDPRRQPDTDPASVHSAYVWRSECMRELDVRAAHVRDAESAILIVGETGTGKSAFARALHARSERRFHHFVDVDCAGLRPERAGLELFGDGDEPGQFDAARAGTLCFDDIGELDLVVQALVLRAVEEGRVRHRGELRDVLSDARVLAVTHHNLLEEVSDRRFRADLYYRIGATTLHLPALRDRRDDIVPLAAHYLVQIAPGMRLDPAAAALLLEHDWPGNLRELHNVVEGAARDGQDGVITRADLQLERDDIVPQRRLSSGTMRRVSVEDARPASAGPKTLDELEREHIRRALESESGHVESAAKLLGIPRSTLYQKLKNYGWGTRTGGLRGR